MTETFSGSKAFLMIPVSAARDEHLLKQPKAILLLGEIISMLNVTGEFYMSNSTLAEKLKCSKKSISNYLSLLEDMNLIRRQVYKKENGEIDYRKITAGEGLASTFAKSWNANSNNAPRETDFHTHGNTLPDPRETDYQTLGKQVATKEEQYKKNNIRRDIYSSDDDEDEESLYKKVINYLNEKLGTKYKANSSINKRLINARAKDGFGFEAFKIVIDNKYASWAFDPKMRKYLRPQTLFGTKFESYLYEKPAAHTDIKNKLLKDDTVENILDQDLPF